MAEPKTAVDVVREAICCPNGCVRPTHCVNSLRFVPMKARAAITAYRTWQRENVSEAIVKAALRSWSPADATTPAAFDDMHAAIQAALSVEEE